MTADSGPQGSQHNTLTGSGNITTGGTFINSPVSQTTAAPPPGPWVAKLQHELAKARQRLEDPGQPAPPADLGDALTAVAGLQRDLADPASPEVTTGSSLRLRIKGLIGALAPVAEIIGGVAAFEEILRHL